MSIADEYLKQLYIKEKPDGIRLFFGAHLCYNISKCLGRQ